MKGANSTLIRAAKLARLQGGNKPRTLEICSGCGGLSLGLLSAGFELSAHIELDREAAESYALNFGGEAGTDTEWAKPRNMETVTAARLVQDLALNTSAAMSFDMVAAGLPCQAFARIGRSKLRSVAGIDDAFQKDRRASMYRRFLEFVSDTQPLAIIIENVPDILNFGGHNIPEEICETLKTYGYNARYTILNAAYFGVPQVRDRLFIVALADSLQATPNFPTPTHYFKLPRGYEASRRVALKHVNDESPYFVTIPTPEKTLQRAIGSREALEDLPIITEHIKTPSLIRKRKLTDVLPYRKPKSSASLYARSLRDWDGFKTQKGTNGHLVRLTPRDFRIFAKMRAGSDYPAALKLAEAFFGDALIERKLFKLKKNSKAYKELRATLVPPYDPAKFPNKWWKLMPSKPSRTLTAHMGKDTYSHIHFDSTQRRTISVREAARLQSFPDGFQFAGAMNAAFRQIGNAVPPLLGLAVAGALSAQLAEAASDVDDSDRRAA